MSATPKRAALEQSGTLLSFALSAVAGVVDVTGWILLGGLFTAHITGNIVVIAATVVQGHAPRLASVLAPLGFVLVTAAVTVVVERGRFSPATALRPLLVVQFLLLTATALVAAFTHPPATGSGAGALCTAMLAVSAMAVQNAALHLTRKPAPTTAVMTGNLVVATIALTELLMRRGDRDAATQWTALWPLLLGFAAGCVLGAVACGILHDLAWVLPAVLALAVVPLGRAPVDR